MITILFSLLNLWKTFRINFFNNFVGLALKRLRNFMKTFQRSWKHFRPFKVLSIFLHACTLSEKYPCFPAFGQNTERHGVSLCIQFKCWKIRTRKTPNTDTFYSVVAFFFEREIGMSWSNRNRNIIQKIFTKVQPMSIKSELHLDLSFSGEKMKSWPLREKCLFSELFWSVFSRIWTEYGEIRSISLNAGNNGP